MLSCGVATHLHPVVVLASTSLSAIAGLTAHISCHFSSSSKNGTLFVPYSEKRCVADSML